MTMIGLLLRATVVLSVGVILTVNGSPPKGMGMNSPSSTSTPVASVTVLPTVSPVPTYDPLEGRRRNGKFTYRDTITATREFGPPDWGKVFCRNTNTCDGWPTNWEG